ncbi:MAG TPA: hypothetical protein VG756_19130 [Pseudonocardiaceae bacterium]|jgi:hypothetical protein|nr:hypothetical protein [Pseudonocardiaceae bacterium]
MGTVRATAVVVDAAARARRALGVLPGALLVAGMVAGCAGVPAGSDAPSTPPQTTAMSRSEFSAPIPSGWSDATATLGASVHGAAPAQVVLVGPVPDPRGWNLVIGEQPLGGGVNSLSSMAKTLETQRQTHDHATNPSAPAAGSLGGEPTEIIQFDEPQQQHSVEIVCLHHSNLWDLVLTTDDVYTLTAAGQLAQITAGWRWADRR